MLLQLHDTSQENVNKLLAYAREIRVDLSLVDDAGDNNTLPGKPLTSEQLTQLIESSRRSGMINLEDAHKLIRRSYNAD